MFDLFLSKRLPYCLAIATQFHEIAVGVSYIEAAHGSVCTVPLDNIE